MKTKAYAMTKIIDNYHSYLVSYSDKGSSICDTDMIEIVSKCYNLGFLVNIIMNITLLFLSNEINIFNQTIFSFFFSSDSILQ